MGHNPEGTQPVMAHNPEEDTTEKDTTWKGCNMEGHNLEGHSLYRTRGKILSVKNKLFYSKTDI